jgi:perosamine synthetase
VSDPRLSASPPKRRTSRRAKAPVDPLADLVPGPEPEVGPLPPHLLGPDGAPRSLRVSDTDLRGNELRYVTECIESNWISSAGPFVRRFEAEFASAVGAHFGVACSSGTAALHLALGALGIGPGDEVIVPAFTMIATANAVTYLGARPVLLDAEDETWNLDPRGLEARIGPRTRAIVPVHTYGHPADMDPILALARARGVAVVEDAAEAHGAVYRGRPVGSLGDAAAFSFYGNKIVSTGEGGMLTTARPELDREARRLRDLAFSEERHFWHERLAFNYRMTNLQAAVGVAQTERLAELVERRRRHGAMYRERLAGVPGLVLAPERDDVKNVFWMYGVRVQAAFGRSRDALRAWLAGRGIETRGFFVPIHAQPIYRDAFRGQRFPVAEALAREGLYLPSGPLLTEREIDWVAESLRAAYAG